MEGEKDSEDSNLVFILIYSIYFSISDQSGKCQKKVARQSVCSKEWKNKISHLYIQRGIRERKNKFLLGSFHSRIFSVFLLQLHCSYIPTKER